MTDPVPYLPGSNLPTAHEAHVPGRAAHADDQSAHSQNTKESGKKAANDRSRRKSADAGRVHARLHDDPAQAELRAAQGCQGEVGERPRMRVLHSWRRPQPSGTFGG